MMWAVLLWACGENEKPWFADGNTACPAGATLRGEPPGASPPSDQEPAWEIYCHEAGTKHGRYTAWHANGAVRLEEEWRRGQLLSLWEWDVAGREVLSLRCAPEEGAVVCRGTARWWYPSGAKAREGAVRNTKMVGVWQSWSPEGALQSEETYDDGPGLHGAYLPVNAGGSARLGRAADWHTIQPPITLPRSASSCVPTFGPHIEVRADGISLDGLPVADGAAFGLTARLQEKKATFPLSTDTVLLSVDRAVPFRQVLPVLLGAELAGYGVNVLTLSEIDPPPLFGPGGKVERTELRAIPWREPLDITFQGSVPWDAVVAGLGACRGGG